MASLMIAILLMAPVVPHHVGRPPLDVIIVIAQAHSCAAILRSAMTLCICGMSLHEDLILSSFPWRHDPPDNRPWLSHWALLKPTP